MKKFFSFSRMAGLSAVALTAVGLAALTAGAAREPGSTTIVGPDMTEPGRGAPGGVHVSKDLNGVVETRENLTLRLNTDLGSVRIVSLERGAAPVARYSVHIETDAREPLASQLLERYVLNARSTASGVEITGTLPQQPARAVNNAQFWVRFELAVPASYGLDINTGAGDILTGDIGGSAALVT
jgi:hypothetical protein